MKSSFAAVLFAVAGVSAHKNVTYTTEILTAVTTYCPEPTTLTHAGTTYTITEATTLTITDCPCTVTKPVTTTTSTCCDAVPTPPAPVPSVPFSNGTTTVATTVTSHSPQGTGVPSFTPSGPAATTTSPPITAGASKTVLSGGLAAVLGLAAYFL